MEKYVPIVREVANKRKVISSFGALNQFTEGETEGDKIFPLVEITSEDDLHRLSEYKHASGQIMVDLPNYLSEDFNVYQKGVSNLIEEYEGSAGFYKEYSDRISIPVISDSVEMPVNYGNYFDIFRDLEDEFEKLALRLFIRGKDLESFQEQQFEDLSNIIRDNDIILFDIVDIGGFNEKSSSNIEYLTRVFDNTTYILNAFDPSDAGPHNYGPVLANEYDVDGFGDFVVSSRFVYPARNNSEVTLRHYFPSEFELRTKSGDNPKDAVNGLKQDTGWDPKHCEYCKQLSHVKEDTSQEKIAEIRTGHYIKSIIDDNFEDIDEYSPQEMDEKGYRHIHGN